MGSGRCSYRGVASSRFISKGSEGRRARSPLDVLCPAIFSSQRRRCKAEIGRSPPYTDPCGRDEVQAGKKQPRNLKKLLQVIELFVSERGRFASHSGDRW